MALVCGTGALSGLAERLAGVSSANEVDGFKLVSREGSDVSMAFHPRPMLLEHLSAEWVDFHLPTAEKTGPVHADVDATYS
jgi:hypothetical protein